MREEAPESVTIIARHGARAPNKAEMRPFATNDAVKAQWVNDEGVAMYLTDDNLSEVGRAQMRALGEHLARKYAHLTTNIEWHSSTASRCVDSGAEMRAGYIAASGGEWPASPLDDYDRDSVFKAWDAKTGDYRDYVDGLKQGKDAVFTARAEKEAEKLAAVWLKLGVTNENLNERLYWSGYLHCGLECETYWGSPKLAIHDALDEVDAEYVEGLARFVWERRFHASGFGDAIGSKVAGMVLSGRAPKGTLRVFSGHDYSILSMLAANGATHYDKILGFGAFVIVEHFKTSSRVYLVPRPFAPLLKEAEAAIKVDDSERLPLK